MNAEVKSKVTARPTKKIQNRQGESPYRVSLGALRRMKAHFLWPVYVASIE